MAEALEDCMDILFEENQTVFNLVIDFHLELCSEIGDRFVNMVDLLESGEKFYENHFNSKYIS